MAGGEGAGSEKEGGRVVGVGGGGPLKLFNFSVLLCHAAAPRAASEDASAISPCRAVGLSTLSESQTRLSVPDWDWSPGGLCPVSSRRCRFGSYIPSPSRQQKWRRMPRQSCARTWRRKRRPRSARPLASCECVCRIRRALRVQTHRAPRVQMLSSPRRRRASLLVQKLTPIGFERPRPGASPTRIPVLPPDSSHTCAPGASTGSCGAGTPCLPELAPLPMAPRPTFAAP